VVESGARRASALWVLLVFLVAQPAHGNLFERFGLGARGAAMGNAMVSLDGDYGAAFNNPAALTGATNVLLGTGLSWLIPDLTLVRNGGETLPQVRPPADNVGMHFGAIFPLFGILERVSLGTTLFVPTAADTRVETIDFTQPHFYRYHALPDRIVGVVSMGLEVHEMISLGVGVQALGRLEGGAVFGIDLPAQRITYKTLEAELTGDVSLIAGLMVRPTPALKIGMAYHQEIALDFRQYIDATIESIGRLMVDVRGTSLYSPHRLTWGVSYMPTSNLKLAFDLEWALWSLAPDPSLDFDLIIDVGPLGIDARQYSSAQTALGGVDTVAPKFGLDWRLNSRYSLRGGYAYVPTPIPVQRGVSNIVDADAHQIGVGGAVHFKNPLARGQAPLSVEIGTLATFLADRLMDKSADDDPVGDYTAGGTIWHTSVTLHHHFNSP